MFLKNLSSWRTLKCQDLYCLDFYLIPLVIYVHQGCQTRIVMASSHDVLWLSPFAKLDMRVASTCRIWPKGSKFSTPDIHDRDHNGLCSSKLLVQHSPISDGMLFPDIPTHIWMLKLHWWGKRQRGSFYRSNGAYPIWKITNHHLLFISWTYLRVKCFVHV